MFGRERCPALKKRSAAVDLERTLAPQRVFQALHHHQTVQRGFPCKESALAPVLVMANVSQQPEPARASDQCSNSGVRNIVVAVDRFRIPRKIPAGFAVGPEKPSAQSSPRHHPPTIPK